jgi:predicted phosphodiesterase
MRLGIISDIHGNLEAFGSVLSDIDDVGVDELICLGDNIGYGPDPVGVVRLLRDRSIYSLIGNHELAVAEPASLQWFNPVARRSLLKTIELMDENTIRFVTGLDRFQVRDGCRFVHGFPPESAATYLFQVDADGLCKTFGEYPERLCFVGHTHELEIVAFGDGVARARPLKKGTTRLRKELRYIINVGSVGQPRDGNNNAKYVIFDSDRDLLEVRFVPYDISVTVQKIIAAGLPESHAMRLW